MDREDIRRRIKNRQKSLSHGKTFALKCFSTEKCSKCDKEKPIKAGGLCSRCYDVENNTGRCESCREEGVLRTGLCDRCYREKHYTGRCEICHKENTLKDGLCDHCYNKGLFREKCNCGSRAMLENGVCLDCRSKRTASDEAACKECGRSMPLKKGLCSTCYKKENYTGNCKICNNELPLTDGLCRTCYDKEHYAGFCDSCGNYGVLIRSYCRSCFDHQEEMLPCQKCGRRAIVDHNGLCKICATGDKNIGVCRVCAKNRPLTVGEMCLECYKEKATGVQHYMRSSIKKVLKRILGKDNVSSDVEEIFLQGQKEPFTPDFLLRDLNGKWCPAQFFNSKSDWDEEYKSAIDFKQFYDDYLRPKNYIMFSSQHGNPEILTSYLKERGFLAPNNLPYGKKVTQKLSKRVPFIYGLQ